jgi:hypothetical protein
MTRKKNRTPAAKREIQSILRNSTREHLVCRDLQHAWEWRTDMTPISRTVDGKRIRTVSRVLSCMRCQTQRMDEYELPTFQRLRSSYTYPDGYLAKRHGTHVQVSDIRQEVFRRMTNGAW